jgi:hypothetical protein
MNVSVVLRATSYGRPVTNLKQSDFLPVLENGQVISPCESGLRVEHSTTAFRLYTVILLDLSGSVVRSPAALRQLKRAVSDFVRAILPESAASAGALRDVQRMDSRLVRLYAFTGKTTLLPLLRRDVDRDGRLEYVATESGDRDLLLSKIEEIGCQDSGPGHEYCDDQSTNLYGAVVEGIRALGELKVRASEGDEVGVRYASGALAVFSDGANTANLTSRKEAIKAIKVAPREFRIYAVGLGTEPSEKTLKAIGRDGYTRAGSMSHDDAPELARDKRSRSLALEVEKHAFTRKIADEANSYYEVDYCSPARSGTVDLKFRASWHDVDRSEVSGSVRFPIRARATIGRCSHPRQPVEAGVPSTEACE